MSWFSSNHYSQIEHQITEERIKEIVSTVHVNTLQSAEVLLVRAEVLRRRGNDGQISLYQIYDILTRLKNQNKISKYDRDGLMKRFEEYLK
jgi:hypothetical protein